MSRKAKVSRRVLRSQNHPDQGHNRLGILWIDMDDAGRAYCWECKVRIPWCDCRQPRPCDCTRCRPDKGDAAGNLPNDPRAYSEAWEALEPRQKVLAALIAVAIVLIAIGIWTLLAEFVRALPANTELPDRSILAPRNTY